MGFSRAFWFWEKPDRRDCKDPRTNRIGYFMKRFLLAIPVLALLSGPAFADNVGTLLKESRAAEAAGNTQNAILYIQSAMVADPARASTYVALGDFYARAHQTDIATQYYHEALTLDPSNSAAKKGIAQDARAEGNAKAAALDKQ
jgi:cytochrome c-type biogenesis protein CcmH/NrfG